MGHHFPFLSKENGRRGGGGGWYFITEVLLLFLIAAVVPTEQLSIKELGSSLISSTCDMLGMECCRQPAVRSPDDAILELEVMMENQFFGQHLAANIVSNALRGHLEDDDSNKALVLSFHGWAGSGKTFLAEMIMKALYKRGVESNYVKFYMASYDFPESNETKVTEYQEKLRNEIMMTISRCQRALFVFDEVDKTPPKVFDALLPFIQHPGKNFKGFNFKRSIFIFLSNIGASEITRITYKNWKDGRRREDLAFTDFESNLQREAFNIKDTGLSKSRVIDRALVDFYVPFLPMEKQHVLACANAEIRRSSATIDPEIIANSLSYWPPVEKLYSQTGCKKVENLVKYYAVQEKYGKNFEMTDPEPEEQDSGVHAEL